METCGKSKNIKKLDKNQNIVYILTICQQPTSQKKEKERKHMVFLLDPKQKVDKRC